MRIATATRQIMILCGKETEPPPTDELSRGRLTQVTNAGVTTKYLYDAEFRRVAKLSGTTVSNEYLFDTEGNQQIELNGSGTVLHTNLYAGGKLIATYRH